MSVRVTTDVFCDGCGRWAHYCVSNDSLIRDAQRAAKAQGWTFDRKGDCQCPACNGKTPKYWPTWEGAGTPTLPRATPRTGAQELSRG